jgi:hypothetical protein
MQEYRPGDWVEAEIKVQHFQVLRNVAITYRNVDAPVSKPIVLQQLPGIGDSEPDTDPMTKGPFSYVSTVDLSARVDTPAQNTPGVYELTEIDIETFAGTPRTIYISNDEERSSFSFDPSARAFRVVEEPKDAPLIMSLNIK